MEFIKKFFDNRREQKAKDEVMARQQEAAVAALTKGDIFPRARERIEREQAIGSNFFSSDLSVREYMLCKEAGFQTIGQVMGSCFYLINLLAVTGRTMGLVRSEYNADKFVSNFGSLVNQSQELREITDAQLKSRRLAVDRMLLEAKAMGAHGVIGVRIKSSHFDWSTRMTEYTAIGTAIRIPGYNSDTVFTSDLNGQEFWQLYKAGYIPRELAFGVCSYYMKCDPETRQIIDPTLVDFMKGRSAQNQEIKLFTAGFYEARNLAMGRLTADAMAVKAEGLVSMNIDYTIQTIEYMNLNKTFHDPIVHFIATGTSIMKDSKREPIHPKPMLCLSVARKTWTDIGDYGGFVPSTLSNDFEDDDDFE